MKKIIFVLLIIILLTGCSSNSKVIGCEKCVYSHFSGKKMIGDKIDSYKKDYNDTNNKVFLGYELDTNDKIIKGYVCGTDKGKTYCLEGNLNNSKYESNKKILDDIYNKSNCTEKSYANEKYYSCTGELTVNISSNSYNYIGTSKSNQCYISNDGTTYCNDN